MTRHARRLLIATLVSLPAFALAPGPLLRPDLAQRPEAMQLTAETSAGGSVSTVSRSATRHKPLRTVTIAVSGDVLIHNNVWASAQRAAARTGAGAFDFRPMLASLRPRISGADLAICHLETPLAPAGGPYSSYPLFSAPPAVVPALRWAGYDACSTASNHSVDQGFAGIERTLDALDRSGLAHTGTARTPREAASPVLLESHGMRIGWVSYTFGTNGMPVDPDKPWSVNLIDVARIKQAAHAARLAGADAVLVALHWGEEYSHTPSAYQRDIADRLARDREITLIYGHHAHVVQSIEKIHGTWVIFGLGNLLAGQGTTASGVDNGMIGLIRLTQRGDGPVRVLPPTYAPTHIDYSDERGEFRVYDVRRALDSGRLDATTAAELRASLAQTRSVVH